MHRKINTIPSIIILLIAASISFFTIINSAKSEALIHPDTLALKTFCNTNTDCMEVISINRCDNFCVNKDISNKDIINKKDEGCDPVLWYPPLELNCGCVNNSCHFK